MSTLGRIDISNRLREGLVKRTKKRLTTEGGGMKDKFRFSLASAPHPFPLIFFFVLFPQFPEFHAEETRQNCLAY